MMTNAATTTSCTMMRILPGMVLRNSEMMTLEKASTAVTEIAMTKAGSSLAVTARAEQMPNTCTMTGLLRESGPKSISLFFFDNSISLILYYYFNDSRNVQ